MPFLVPTTNETKTPKFYIVRGAAPHLGISFTVKKMAQSFLKQNKKVLVFDALLGLKNFPVNNKNAKKIPQVLQKKLALTEIITKECGFDILAGSADQNLTTLSLSEQQYLKLCLVQLAKNYDVILIDMPFQVLTPIWEDLGENLWIISSDKNVIINTLMAGQKKQPLHLIVNQQKAACPLNQLYIFVKSLCPECQITLL